MVFLPALTTSCLPPSSGKSGDSQGTLSVTLVPYTTSSPSTSTSPRPRTPQRPRLRLAATWNSPVQTTCTSSSRCAARNEPLFVYFIFVLSYFLSFVFFICVSCGINLSEQYIPLSQISTWNV